MSDSGLESLAAEAAVEAKLAESGADTIRRHTFDEAPEAAPAEETAAERARNELGQFTSAEEQPEEAPVEETLSADEAMGDPAVAAYLKKYGGDVDKALEAAVHAQRKLGQQSSEVGNLRTENEQYATLVSELQGLRSDLTQQQQPQMDQATVDWYDQQVMENPAQALEWARQQQNPLLVQRGLSVWKDFDPYEAAVYTNRLENQALHAQLQQQVSQQARLPLDATVNLALQNVRGRNPQFANYDDALETTLNNHPFAAKALEQAASSGDPAQIEGAIETLYSLAVGDTLQTIARTVPDNGDYTTTQDVAVPTVSETRDPAPEPTPTDRFREAFRQETERARRGAWVAE